MPWGESSESTLPENMSEGDDNNSEPTVDPSMTSLGSRNNLLREASNNQQQEEVKNDPIIENPGGDGGGDDDDMEDDEDTVGRRDAEPKKSTKLKRLLLRIEMSSAALPCLLAAERPPCEAPRRLPKGSWTNSLWHRRTSNTQGPR